MSSVLAVLLLGVAVVQASPAHSMKQSMVALTTSQIDHFTPYTHYASAAYCTPAQTMAWKCGTNCKANPHFVPVASGGNGGSVQYWYVGYDPTLNVAIVAHEGSDPKKMKSLVTDAEILLTNLDPTLFPGINPYIQVHKGFASHQARTATEVLAAVQQVMSKYGTTSVTMVGHSLGAALSLLDSVYLFLWLPSGTTFKTVCYGLPRVGNGAFADFVDANLHLTHINNERDPIPICPGKFLGFVHPSGEVHIRDASNWASCPGHDNPSRQCIVGDVRNVWDGKLRNHHGPYNGIKMGC